MMRVALVGPLPPPSGGMANQTLQLSRLLSQENIEVETVQVNAPYTPAWIGRVRGLRAIFRLIPYLANLWRAFGRADIVHLMANSGWSWHLFSAPAIWLARVRGIPLIVNYRGGYAREFLQRQSAIVAVSMKRAASLVVPSRFLHQVFDEFGLPSRVVPNIVDVERFKPPVRVGDRPHVILVSRNLEPIYDNATAIRSLRLLRQSLPDALLLMAGSGPEAENLKKLAEDMGLQFAVEFTGRIAAEDMPALYARAGIALNPSRVDNMPNSVLEALAAGVPVVSTNVGGVPFIVEHEKNALLVPPGDEVAMASAMLRIFQDAALAERLTAEGRKTAESCAWPSVRDTLFQVYRDALDKRMSGTDQ